MAKELGVWKFQPTAYKRGANSPHPLSVIVNMEAVYQDSTAERWKQPKSPSPVLKAAALSTTGLCKRQAKESCHGINSWESQVCFITKAPTYYILSQPFNWPTSTEYLGHTNSVLGVYEWYRKQRRFFFHWANIIKHCAKLWSLSKLAPRWYSLKAKYTALFCWTYLFVWLFNSCLSLSLNCT